MLVNLGKLFGAGCDKMELERQERGLKQPSNGLLYQSSSDGSFGVSCDFRADDSLEADASETSRTTNHMRLSAQSVSIAITLKATEMTLIDKQGVLKNQNIYACLKIECDGDQMKFSGPTETVDSALVKVYSWLREISRVHLCISSEFKVHPELFSERVISEISGILQENLICVERCNDHVPANDCLVLVFHPSQGRNKAIKLIHQLMHGILWSEFIEVPDEAKMNYLNLKFSKVIKQLEKVERDGKVKISVHNQGYNLQFFGSPESFETVKESLNRIIGSVRHSKFILKCSSKLDSKFKTYISGVEQENDVSVSVSPTYDPPLAMNNSVRRDVVHGKVQIMISFPSTPRKGENSLEFNIYGTNEVNVAKACAAIKDYYA